MENANIVLMEGRIFGLDSQLIFDAVFLAINIFIIFTMMSYMFFDPVRAILKKRQDSITAQREEIQKSKSDAFNLKSEYERKLTGIDKEAENILNEARKKALKNRENIIEDAKSEAEKIIVRAKSEIELERERAADDIKREIISVAGLMAGKAAAMTIDEKLMDELVEETLREIGDRTWQS